MYFNTYYNADRLFKQGVKEMKEGRPSSGRGTLGVSIEKAERIVRTKPGSRWADDALRLIVRARLLREEWEETRDAAEQLLGYARTERDSAEVAGFLGAAEFHLGHHARADSLLTVALPLAKREAERGDFLLYRGRARVALGRSDAADEDLREAIRLRPKWLAPQLARARLLATAGRSAETTAALERLLALQVSRAAEDTIVETFAEAAKLGPESALAALAEVETSARSRAGQAALVKLRADLRAAAGEVEKARSDYELTAGLAPGSTAARQAEFVALCMDLASVATVEAFLALKPRFEAVASMAAGRLDPEATQLSEKVLKVAFWISEGRLGLLLAAETARDQLRLPRLARELFLTYGDLRAEDPWAPKAILAAIALSPVDSGAANGSMPGPSPEELRRRLLEDYRDSAYVQALVGGEGEPRFTYEELEEGLRRQLQRLHTQADNELRQRRTVVQ